MSVADKLQTLQNIKTDIKTSILNKGVDVNDDFTTYANAINNIETGGGSGGDTPNYSYLSNTVDEDGLRALGWDDESIGYFKDNTLHYEWQNDDYIVSEGNKSLYGIVNAGNISSFKNNPDFVYCPKFEIGQKSDMSSLFEGCIYLKSIPYFDISRVNNMSYIFRNCSSLKTIPLLDTSNVTNMRYMFMNCSSLTTIPEIDTSNIKDFAFIFNGCKALKTIPLLDTSNVTDMQSMFSGCSTLTDIPPIDTSNVTIMRFMFNDCSTLTDIPPIDTSNVTDMERMINGCKALKTIPLLDTSNVTKMNYIFGSCSSLTTIPEIDTSNVTRMDFMFYDCKNLTSLPRFNVPNLTNISTLFGYNSIATLTDVGGWENLKINWNDSTGLAKLPNLTYQSCINILNGLYDFTGNGETPTSSQGKLKVNANFLTTVGDEISIGTDKGWTITA